MPIREEKEVVVQTTQVRLGARAGATHHRGSITTIGDRIEGAEVRELESCSQDSMDHSLVSSSSWRCRETILK